MDFNILNLLFRCSKEFSHKKIYMRELSDTEYMICTYVFSHPNCSQEDVSSALKVDKTTIAKALLVLERKECIGRVQSTEDKRKKLLTITETGREKISDLMNIHDEWLSRILTCLSADEQKQFENYCERLLAAAEELMEKKDYGGLPDGK